MMKLIPSKLKLDSNHFRLVYGALFHSSSAPSDTLFLRISRSGDPTIPVNRILDQWIEEGRDVKHSELQFFVKQLRVHRRYAQALQVSEWMSNERNLHLSSGDTAVRLDLIAKVHGLDQAEKYYNSISDPSRDFKVLGALLNCYARHNSVEKAEAVMQKIKEHASEQGMDLAVSYNVMLKLYAQVGQFEKLDSLMQEMKEKNIYDSITLNTRLNTYVTTKDIDGMEKLLSQMEADPRVTVDWLTFSSAADGYIQAGQYEKSFGMLQKAEQLIKGKMRRTAYESLLSKYGAIGKRDDVYRVWEICKNLNYSRNTSYICILSALSKLNDIEGAERILEEWEAGNTCYDSRIPNIMISAYCKNGLMEKAEQYIEKLLKGENELDGSTWDRLACGYHKCNDMDNAVQAMKKAVSAGRLRGRPNPFTLAACIDHLKEKGDLELALEILRICVEREILSCSTYDGFLSGEISETKALNLIKGDYNMKDDEVPDGEKEHEVQAKEAVSH